MWKTDIFGISIVEFWL